MRRKTVCVSCLFPLISKKFRFEGRRPPPNALAQVFGGRQENKAGDSLPALPVPYAKNPWLWYGLSGQVFRLRHQTGHSAFPGNCPVVYGAPLCHHGDGFAGEFHPVPMFGRGKRPAGTRSPNGPYHTPSRGFCQFPDAPARALKAHESGKGGNQPAQHQSKSSGQ